ncbi:ATP-binding protein [Thiothrix lacustris]|uniref:ATP-binding protein n=1 Tax=Thiothrix lacustris TaxID=525917 RepID=A0ABY9MU28_9GAMM|nr:ATP-binding protein [Thiothrix lacustris]WML92172.1 ATP-binding protein [Thiothrix lacustris]WMP19098.1 ATP-binding protein [Thiothrix lacustris]
MKFYNRESEQQQLQFWSEQATDGQSSLTMLVGRRRVGKTALLHETFQRWPTLYLFISRKAEPLLCDEFTEQIRTQLNIPVFGQPKSLREVLEILFQYAKSQPLTLILDEFQDIARVNSAVFSELQHLWDQYRASMRLHLICCGSLYSLMTRLFQNSREPLFGRADHRINLQPLKPAYLSELLHDQQRFSPEAMLIWYTLSGGIPKYLEWLAQTDPQQDIWEALINEHSLILEEGRYRLAEEFGAEQNTYFSILATIASGKTSRSEIESVLEISIGPYLKRLEEEFDILQRIRPVLASSTSRQIKYRIQDAFLSFWFRFIYRYRSAIEIENFAFIRQAIQRDFPTYSGLWLEQLIHKQLAASGQYNLIGGYWEASNKNEIDVVALNELDKTALIGEVKRNPKSLRLSHLKEKARKLEQKLAGYDITYRGFSLEDLK